MLRKMADNIGTRSPKAARRVLNRAVAEQIQKEGYESASNSAQTAVRVILAPFYIARADDKIGFAVHDRFYQIHDESRIVLAVPVILYRNVITVRCRVPVTGLHGSAYSSIARMRYVRNFVISQNSLCPVF